MSTNIVWHGTNIKKEHREELLKQKGVVLWFTGYSGSGKSTVANEVEKRIYELGHSSYLLDGDNVRHGLNKDLDFSDNGRKENIRRISEVSKLFVDSGLITLTAFISPFKEDRQNIREMLNAGEFIEVYVKCSLEECEKRDVKGLYKLAREGKIEKFTGISSPYEEPVNPEIIVETDKQTLEESADQIIKYLKDKKII